MRHQLFKKEVKKIPYKNKKDKQENQKQWAKKNRDKRRKYRKTLRNRVLEMLGGKCAYCDCDVFEVLEINHINGGGGQESKSGIGTKMLLHAILNGTRKIDDLNLACRVCNARHYITEIKGIEDKWTITWNENLVE